MNTDVMDKVETLERALKVQRALVVACIGVLCAIVAFGSGRQPQEELTVRRLRIVDDRGTVRMILGYTKNGATQIRMYDEAGNGRLTMLASNVLNEVYIEDASGHDVPRAALGLNDRGPFLRLADGEGKVRGACTVTEQSAALMLAAVGEEESIGLYAEKDKPHLGIRDAKEMNRCLLGMYDRGPALVLADEKTNPRALVRLKDDEPSIRLLGNDGKDVWRAPEVQK
jgi:hypothetical protein